MTHTGVICRWTVLVPILFHNIGVAVPPVSDTLARRFSLSWSPPRGRLSAHGELKPAFSSVYCAVASLNVRGAAEASQRACRLVYEGDMFAQAGSSTEFAESSWRLAYRVRWVRMSQRSSDHSANVVAQVGCN